MGGTLALVSEIHDRVCQTAAEENRPVAVDRDAGGQRVIVAQHPVGQAQPVGGRTFGQRGQEGGDAGRDDLVFFRRVVGAAVEDVGHPHVLRPVLAHDHRRVVDGAFHHLGPLGQQIVALGVQLLVGFVEMSQIVVFQQFALGGSAFFRGGGQGLADRSRVQRCDLGGVEHAVVKAQVVKRAGEGSVSPRPGDKVQRVRRFGQIVGGFGFQRVFGDGRGDRFPVDVDLDPLGLARAIVSDGNVGPLRLRDGFAGDDLHATGRPLVDQVQARPFPLLDPQIPAAKFFPHPGGDGGMSGLYRRVQVVGRGKGPADVQVGGVVTLQQQVVDVVLGDIQVVPTLLVPNDLQVVTAGGQRQAGVGVQRVVVGRVFRLRAQGVLRGGGSQPGGEGLLHRLRSTPGKLLLDGDQLFVDLSGLFLVTADGEPHQGCLVTSPGLQPGIRGVVEVGEEPIVLFLADRVVLVVVALGTFHGEAQEDVGGGLDAVDDIFDSQFLGKGAPLVRRGVVAVEAGGDLLVEGRVGHQVASDLLAKKLRERFVVLVGLDDPVPPGPHVARTVGVHHRGVAVAGGVHPGQRHPLAKVL